MSRLVLEWANFRESLLDGAERHPEQQASVDPDSARRGGGGLLDHLRDDRRGGAAEQHRGGDDATRRQHLPDAEISQHFNTGPDARRRFRNRKDITYEQALQVQEKATLAEAVGIEAWRFGRIVFWQGAKDQSECAAGGGERRRA